MKVKLLVVLALVAGLAHPLAAAALALADVELQSYLNQKLSAKIQLLDIPEGGVEELDIRVSENRDSGLTNRYTVLEHEVVVEGADYFLLVSSQEAIREPILSFVVELNWPAGRLLRNYALIIDPK